MLRRLHPDQPETFAFTPANQAWAEGQISKYPEGRQASAIIPLLWRAQEQEGWLSRPAIEHVAAMLGMAYIRALEVATFYFMFQLTPTGSVAHVQVCGTTSCMICGAEDLIAVCKEKIANKAHSLSADGKFTWEEVECLGACANAPMAQIGKDYYEDLTAERFGEILDELAAGKVPVPGPQNGRYAAEPLGGLTSLKEFESGHTKYNASAQLAVDIGDTVKRIDGTEVPLRTPWLGGAAQQTPKKAGSARGRSKGEASDKVSELPGEAPNVKAKGRPEEDGTGGAPAASQPTPKGVKARGVQGEVAPKGDVPAAPAEAATGAGTRPAPLAEARGGKADDLKRIKGVGPKLETLLHELGFYHFDQVAGWSAEEVAWVDENLKGFKGRVSRDGWVEQAKLLAAGGETEFSKKVDKGDVY